MPACAAFGCTNRPDRDRKKGITFHQNSIGTGMGKLTAFEIILANNGVFYSGNIIQGHVNIELSEPMKMRGIRMKFEGKAYVHWTESSSNGDSSSSDHYSASENYFNQDMLLHGIWSGQGSTMTELPQGRHTFPFQFQLPQGLPSSFEGIIGHVRYSMKATIDKPWKFDITSKRAFTIIGILDLNAQPSYMNRMQGSNHKNLCCLCCKSGPITASFCIECQGYVPGEGIKLFAEISNGTGRRMVKSYVDLKRVTTFHATFKSKVVTEEVTRVTRPGIDGHREDSWNGEQLVIPPIPPSFLDGCHIIDIRYVLQLHVDPSGPALDLEIPLEIVIGTIPLLSVVQQHPPMQPSFPIGFAGNDAASSAPEVGAMPQNNIPNFPPQSYAECVTGKVDISEGDNKHMHGDLSFAPVYTYYDWGHQPATLPSQSAK